MVNVHLFFLGSTSFIYVRRPRGGFLHCPVDPPLAHLGWHGPLVDDSSKVGAGHFRIDPSFLPLTGSSCSGSENEVDPNRTVERTCKIGLRITGRRAPSATNRTIVSSLARCRGYRRGSRCRSDGRLRFYVTIEGASMGFAIRT